jgi:hypothetical protein
VVSYLLASRDVLCRYKSEMLAGASTLFASSVGERTVRTT